VLAGSGVNAGPQIDTANVFNTLLPSSTDGDDDGSDPIDTASNLVRHYFRWHTRGGSLSLKIDGVIPQEILARLEPY
jgi:hypothetical protein